MALVSAKEMLEKAVAGHYAVPAINQALRRRTLPSSFRYLRVPAST